MREIPKQKEMVSLLRQDNRYIPDHLPCLFRQDPVSVSLQDLFQMDLARHPIRRVLLPRLLLSEKRVKPRSSSARLRDISVPLNETGRPEWAGCFRLTPFWMASSCSRRCTCPSSHTSACVRPYAENRCTLSLFRGRPCRSSR